jgi:UDP-N-acetylmuramate--alanine ligase
MIGIGGIGMSALARYYNSRGYTISGSDGKESELVNGLKSEGVNIFIGHTPENISKDVDVIVYTVAISSDNIELLEAHHISNNSNKKVKILTYAEALGEMSKEKRVIAVCGSHGKTTTTAMAYFAMREAGLDPSVIVGSLIEIEGKKTNYISSINKSSEWLIIEACEYKRSFMNYFPEIVLVTNIDNDHLDYFKDLEDIKNTFQDFIHNMKDNGKLIIHTEQDYLNTDFKNILKINADQIEIGGVELSVAGEHNRKNAQLVIAAGNAMGLENNKVRAGLQNFHGTWRRQEYKGKYFDMDFYDDYAHHPTEIKATLSAFVEKYKYQNSLSHNKESKIVAIFQPHLYSRTKLLFEDFSNSFSDADDILILPIYAAREKHDDSINSEMLVREIQNNHSEKKCIYIKDFETLKDYISINADKNNIYVTLGAGDVDSVYALLK